MTDTEQLAHLVKRILGNKEMYGGESAEDKMSKVIDSLDVEDFDENTTNDTDTDFDNSESEKSEDGFSSNSNSDTSNSDSDSSNSSNPSEKALEFLNKRSSNNDSDN